MKSRRKKMEGARKIRDSTFTWVSKCILLDGYSKKIGGYGLAVYSVLATCANDNQECFPTIEYISNTLNCSRNTVSKYILLLEKNKLITVKRKKQFHNVYQLLKIRCPKNEHQQYKKSPNYAQNLGTNETMKETNKRKIDIESETWKEKIAPEVFVYQKLIRHSRLSFDLARDLNDPDGLPFYRSIVEKYSEEFLRETLDQVLKVPEKNIKKSRAALFNHLIQQHGK